MEKFKLFKVADMNFWRLKDNETFLPHWIDKSPRS